MDSEADSSSNIPESTVSKSKRVRTATATWAHTREALDHEPEFKGQNRILYCHYCLGDSLYSSPVTTNFRKHLLLKHKISVKEEASPLQSTIHNQLQQLYSQADSTNQLDEINTQVLQNALNQAVINEALISFIVVQRLPFRVVELPEFHTFCQSLNTQSQQYLPTTHAMVANLIRESWQA